MKPKAVRLDKHAKAAFVLAAMQDIPNIDYTEQFRALVVADVVRSLPEKVRAVYDDETTRSFLETRWRYIDDCHCMGSVNIINNPAWSPTQETITEARRLHELFETQRGNRNTAQAMLEAAIEPYNTLEKALEALPEFAKYLPTPEEPTRNLPVAKLADNLSALGWVPLTKSTA